MITLTTFRWLLRQAVLGVLWGCSTGALLADSDAITLLGSNSQLLGWTSGGWRGMSAQISRSETDPVILEIAPNGMEKVQPWCGGFWQVPEDNASSVIPADGSALRTKVLRFQVQGLKSAASGADQPMQVQLVLAGAEGKKLSTLYIPLDAHFESTVTDAGATSSWQQVSVPLSDFKLTPAQWATVTGIRGIFFQLCYSASDQSKIDIRQIEVLSPPSHN